MRTVEEVYGSAFAEEEAFQETLDQSLAPRGSDLMFDLVAELGQMIGKLNPRLYVLTRPADGPDGHVAVA